MEVIHITPEKNLCGIKKYGIIPNKPYLPSHYNLFKKYVKSDKTIYMTPITAKERTRKYMKDFVYFQIYGKPRNLYFKNKRDIKNIYCVPLSPEKYVALKFDIDDEEIKYNCLHC